MTNYSVKSCGNSHKSCIKCTTRIITDEFREKMRTKMTLQKLDPEYIKKLSMSQTGRKHSQKLIDKRILSRQVGKGWASTSEETRQKLRISRIKHMELILPDCKCVAHNPRSHGKKKITKIELILIDFLQNAGFKIETQASFGLFHVDAFLPEYNLAFEADGTYWHQRKEVRERDIRRDKELLEKYGIITIRLTEKELEKMEKERISSLL